MHIARRSNVDHYVYRESGALQCFTPVMPSSYASMITACTVNLGHNDMEKTPLLIRYREVSLCRDGPTVMVRVMPLYLYCHFIGKGTYYFMKNIVQ